MELILGSQSPRRSKILSYFNLHFKQISSDFDESLIPFKGDPNEYVKILSMKKGEALNLLHPTAVILTADTIVYFNGKVYGKPRNLDEAFEYLKQLSGNWHQVFTGLSVFYQNQIYQAVEETQVQLHYLTEKQIEVYHQNHEFADKAGAYMIQGSGGIVVKQIKGCYYNVMGLPINSLVEVLKPAGIDLWEHLKEK